MLDKVKLEYVESAWIILYQLTNSEPKLITGATDLFQKNLKFILDKFENNKLIFSGLFNAYTEDKNVERLKTVIDFNGTHGLHDYQYADSGGLQLVTTGAVVNDELKRQIYTFQAENSDFAFSFDEIPAEKKDNKSRYYYDKNLHVKGSTAGENLQEHIDIFKTLKTNTKLIPIVQGFDKAQITTYTENMLNQIKKNDLKNIGAIACSNAHSNSFGAVDSFMSLQHLDIPTSLKKHTHLLGASGIDRIAPVLTMIRNGLTEDLERLSFDSSFHTQSYVYGEVQRNTQHLFDGTKIHRLGLTRNTYVESRFNEMADFWKDHETFNFDNLDDIFKHSLYDKDGINSPTKQLKNRKEEDYFKNVNVIQMHILFNIYKYLSLLDDFIEDKISLFEIFHNKKKAAMFSGLPNVKSYGEYVDWREHGIRTYGKGFQQSEKVFEKLDIEKVATNALF